MHLIVVFIMQFIKYERNPEPSIEKVYVLAMVVSFDSEKDVFGVELCVNEEYIGAHSNLFEAFVTTVSTAYSDTRCGPGCTSDAMILLKGQTCGV
jgi:hypothetical protein